MKLNQYIDHTILKADTQKKEVIRICQEAIDNDFYSVCINSCHVSLVKSLLKNTDVKVTSVIGFPLGAMDTESKAFEAKKAVENGADEIDMVINIGALRDREYEYVLDDIRKVLDSIGDRILKVIIEASLLNDEEKIMACKLAKEAGAHFIKTSTGFSTGGATVEDVKLIRSVVGEHIGIKASGGIKSKDKAIQMIEAGATRLGASSSVSIVSHNHEIQSDY